ncbi:hypothetical protein RvY_02060 [Ramazzottius varieornatus]|uniref:Uncharacterized protein n=1 Tax=Ramazzottius varieornatus TaxID=947166 RepID=A0A1D1UII1_RAMVA|nr:hypothetical protein RvY_02060 [Ramazzottius varieornatus]
MRSSFEHIDDEGRECIVQLRPCFGGANCPRYGVTGRIDAIMCYFQTLPRTRIQVRPLPTSTLGGIFQCDSREVRKSLWMNSGSLTLVASIFMFDRADDHVHYQGDMITSKSAGKTETTAVCK